jgi:hypothetical protein
MFDPSNNLQVFTTRSNQRIFPISELERWE